MAVVAGYTQAAIREALEAARRGVIARADAEREELAHMGELQSRARWREDGGLIALRDLAIRLGVEERV